jgi:hypothetical protein
LANASAYAEKAMLDWLLGGATPTRPAAHGLGLSLGTPTSISGSEMSVSAYVRKTVAFGAAASPAGSASNTAAVLFTVSSACTIKGWQLWDTVLSHNSGNMLAQGLLSVSSVMVAGDILSFSAGAIVLTQG